MNVKFETHKVRNQIRRAGKQYVIRKQTTNDFGEKSGDRIATIPFFGLYHETNSYIKRTVGDAAITTTKKVPMILALTEELEGAFGDTTVRPEVNDTIEFGDKMYKVNGLVDIQNWGTITDISLELVDV